MPSPITADDFPILKNTAPLCQRLGALIAGYDAMKEFFAWFLNEDAEISNEVLVGIDDRMMPVGSVIMWCASTLPADNWIECRGQALKRTEYPILFSRLGTTFTTGTDNTVFMVPNLVDKFVMGASTTGSGDYARGASGGLKEVVLTEAQMPTHDHTTTLQHSPVPDIGPGVYVATGNGDGSHTDQTYTSTPKGSSTAHENRPPYVALVYLIKVDLIPVV